MSSTSVSGVAWQAACAAPAVSRIVGGTLALAAVLAGVALAGLRFERSSSVLSVAILAAAGLAVGNWL